MVRMDDGDDGVDDDDDNDGACIGVMTFCSFAIAIGGGDELLCIGMLEDTKDMVADDIIIVNNRRCYLLSKIES
jgi:hypothetical protein